MWIEPVILRKWLPWWAIALLTCALHLFGIYRQGAGFDRLEVVFSGPPGAQHGEVTVRVRSPFGTYEDLVSDSLTHGVFGRVNNSAVRQIEVSGFNDLPLDRVFVRCISEAGRSRLVAHLSVSESRNKVGLRTAILEPREINRSVFSVARNTFNWRGDWTLLFSSLVFSLSLTVSLYVWFTVAAGAVCAQRWLPACLGRYGCAAALWGLAMVLRLPCLLWGLGISPDEVPWHPDEYKAWTTVAGFPERYLDNTQMVYGTLMQNFVGLLLLPGRFMAEYGGLIPDSSWSLVAAVSLRVVNCSVSSLLPGLILLLLEVRVGRFQALLWGLVAACMPFHVFNSCFCTLDCCMAAAVAAVFWRAEKLSGNYGRWSNVALLGGLCGGLIGMKVTGVFFMLPVLAAYCGVVWRFNAGNVTVSGKNKLSACFRLLLVLAGSAAIVCVLASPHMFLFFREWFDHLVFQRRQWLEPANAQASGKLLQQWLHEFRLAFGAALIVLVIPGFLLVVIRRSLLPAAAFVGVCIYAVQMQGLLVARYLIVAIPVLIFCVASGFGAGRIVPRVAAQSLPVIVLLLNSVDLYCGYCSRLGVDTRQACATYLSSLAGGQVIWFSRLTPAITVDTWKFPRVAESHMTVTDSFEKAELLCISDYEWNTMMRALDSPLLGPGDRWPVEQALVWREREIPPPEYFRLFRSLRDGSSDLRLIAEFRREFLFEPEFSDPGLRIFDRRSGQLTEDSLGSRGFQKSNGEVCCSSVRVSLKGF